MKKETNQRIKNLKVDGGATKNGYLMQFQSDILHTVIKLPKCLETTALGAAYMAGLQTGYYQNLESIKRIHEYQAIYEPKMALKEFMNIKPFMNQKWREKKSTAFIRVGKKPSRRHVYLSKEKLCQFVIS